MFARRPSRSRTPSLAATLALIACAMAGLGAFAQTAAPAGGGQRPSIRIAGNQWVDGQGHRMQLRGVNVSGLEETAIAGWAWVDKARTQYDPWGDAHLGVFGGDDYPVWANIKAWDANVVRLPFNEASWLGLTTYDNDGKPRKADPGGNYRAVLIKSVNDAVANGFLVILDLHLAGPNVTVPGQPTPVPSTPMGSQNPMANADHSLALWTSVANTFKNNPAVMFELFNEPYFQKWLTFFEDPWDVWLNGGIVTKYLFNGAPTDYKWRSAGMQQMVDAVRATGATNVVLVGGLSWSADLSGWLAHRPRDPLNQLAAVWHPYPKSTVEGSLDAMIPGLGNVQYEYAAQIMAANIPVILTELGDHSAPGASGAPFASIVLRWADAHDISYLGWGWNPWGGVNFDLIKDASGTPTDGYGTYFQQHLKCRAAARTSCP